MNKIINKYQAVCSVVWIAVLCIIILRPFSLIIEKPAVSSNQQMSMQSGAIRGDYLAAQKFVAPYSHLQNIRIYFLDEAVGEEFRFILFDADMNAVADKNIIIDDMEETPGLYTIQIDLDVEAGMEYCYMIQGISTDFHVAYETTQNSGTVYNRALFYGGTEVTGYNIITEYYYEIPFGKGKSFICYAIVVLSGVVISVLSKWYYKKHPERNHLLTVEKAFKWTASPIVIAGALVCMIAIWPCFMFSNGVGSYIKYNAADIIFNYTGIAAAAGILLYGICHKRSHKSNDMGLSALRDRWRDYLQTGFFAMAIQAAVHYMNALYENHHLTAYREMLIYFGLAVIVTYKRKEIFNRINLIYLATAAAAGFAYCHVQAASVETEDEMRILRLTIYAAIVAGVVIINTISLIIRRRIGRISGYGIAVALLFILLIIFRNTRGWVIYLACAFSLYYLRISAWEERGRLLRNICNGILLNFMVLTGYCLLHRPYLIFIQSRYSFVFHTVTVTAEYLSLVVCAALVKLLSAYRREAKLSYIWKELTVFSISTVYLILTLSRTGYLAIVVVILIVIPIVCMEARHKFKTLCRITAMLTVAVILCFPAVFTLQRIVPAVAARPQSFEIEWLPEEIKDRRDTDSEYYMTIRRFIQLFENKVLGIPEEKCIKTFNIVKNDKGSDKMLVASAALSGAEFSGEAGNDEAGGIPEETDVESYANGRLELFKLYISNLNMTGHDVMEVIMPDGTIKGPHAHNTYIQAAYDHGIPVGIIFLVFGACTLVQSAVYYKNRKEDRECSLLPFALLIVFAVIGLTEWIFHPCNPVAFCMLSALAPLLCDMKKEYQEDYLH